MAGLVSLVDKSLVRYAEGPDGEPRYAMLETIREFGLERLAESGEEAAVRAAHAAHFFAVAEEAEAKGFSSSRATTRATRTTSRRWPAGSSGWRPSSATSAPRSPGWRSTTRASGCYASSRHCPCCGTAGVNVREGWRWYERALDLVGPTPTRERAIALGEMSGLAHRANDERAVAIGEAALAVARQVGDPHALCHALLQMGIAVGFRGDLARSWALHQEALAGWRARGNRYGSSNVLVHLGIVAHERGDPAAASGYLSEAVGLCEAGNQVWLGAVALASLGGVVLDGGAAAEAAGWFRRSLALQAQHGDGAVSVFGLLGMARVAAARQRPEPAARLLGAARAAFERYGRLLYPWATAQLAETETTLRERLGAEAFAAAWAAGRSMAITDAIAEAEALAEAATAPASPHPTDQFGLSARELDVLRSGRGRPHQRRDRGGAVHQPANRRQPTSLTSSPNSASSNRAEAIAVAHRHGLG